MISGKIGINLAASWYQPKKLTEPNVDDAVERAMQFELGWFAEPILLTGDYPTVMKEQIARKSQAQGAANRLPQFTDQEKGDIKGIRLVSYGREKTCLQGFANNKGADQPARSRSLISAFVIRLLESITSRLATSEISIF